MLKTKYRELLLCSPLMQTLHYEGVVSNMHLLENLVTRKSFREQTRLIDLLAKTAWSAVSAAFQVLDEEVYACSLKYITYTRKNNLLLWSKMCLIQTPTDFPSELPQKSQVEKPKLTTTGSFSFFYKS